MRWLKELADAAGQGRSNRDEWWYKDCYNEGLMKIVNDRISEVETGLKKADSFLICGAVNFVKQLKEAGIRTFLASGTDRKILNRKKKQSIECRDILSRHKVFLLVACVDFRLSGATMKI